MGLQFLEPIRPGDDADGISGRVRILCCEHPMLCCARRVRSCAIHRLLYGIQFQVHRYKRNQESCDPPF